MTELKYYTSTDFGIMFLRGCVLPAVMAYLLGWLYGLVIYFIAFKIYYKLMYYCLGYDALSALDEFFLLDNPMNRANIITVVKTDKMRDYLALRQKIIDLAMVHPRLSHSLKKVLGEYYFVPLQPAEL